MAHVVFFTKPGCLTGIKQITLLKQSGHDVEPRSILTHPWTADELLSYFGDLPVSAWFNPNSPRITSGEISPETFDQTSAIAAMLEDHLLIRRPLLQVGVRRKCGFDLQEINDWIGVSEAAVEAGEDLQSCSSAASPCTP